MALDFTSGYGGGVNCGDDSSLQNLDVLSISVWIHPTGWGLSSYGRIACKEVVTPAGWELFVDNGGDPYGVGTLSVLRPRATTDTEMRAFDNAISLNQWQHVAVVFGTVPALFINGVEVSSYKVYQAGSGAISSDIGADMIIGNRPSFDRDFDGHIEDVRLYETELSDSEIQAIFLSRGRDQIVRSLVGRWGLNEQAPGVTLSTSTVADLSNNKNNGSSSSGLEQYSEGVVAMRRTA